MSLKSAKHSEIIREVTIYCGGFYINIKPKRDDHGRDDYDQ